MLKYLRLRLFYRYLKPLGEHTRRQRMAWFADFLRDTGSERLRILDIGGQPALWEMIERPLDLTLLNLPGVEWEMVPSSGRHRFTYVEGDGCDARQFADGEFDIVFSNSVIEHVGGPERQEAFAREIRRIGRHYWVQTPSKFFPIEAHCGMPGWWFYPPGLRGRIIERWRRDIPEWAEMVETTRVLSKARLRQLFPGGRIRTERVLAFPKSYTIHSA
jgi:hypothetical protein